VVIRSSADPRSVAALALRIVHEMNATAVVSNVVPLASVVDQALAPWRLTTWTIAVLGVFSIGLTVLGLVAHLGLELRLRLPEFAIRAAIGASPRHLRRAIVIDAVRMTAVGLTAGAAGASVAAHGLRPLLFAVAETDPITWVGAAMALLLISGLTALVLARKASAVNPTTALRP
jgi:putative ABC transport system permease protein